MKIAIVGTRNPGVSYPELERILLSKTNASKLSFIASEGVKGNGTYTELFAIRRHILLMEYHPNYSKYVRKASLRRNNQIVRDIPTIIAILSPYSKETFHSIRETECLSKRPIVVTIPLHSSMINVS